VSFLKFNLFLNELKSPSWNISGNVAIRIVQSSSVDFIFMLFVWLDIAINVEKIYRSTRNLHHKNRRIVSFTIPTVYIIIIITWEVENKPGASINVKNSLWHANSIIIYSITRFLIPNFLAGISFIIYFIKHLSSSIIYILIQKPWRFISFFFTTFPVSLKYLIILRKLAEKHNWFEILRSSIARKLKITKKT
jgi:hypothetical protein